MIKGFLLDIDGTLLASNEGHAEAWHHALQHFGYETTVDEIRTLIGMGADKLLPALVPDLATNKGKSKEIAAYRKTYFLENIVRHVKPTLGARELVTALLRHDMRLVIATSADSEELQILLQKAQVADLLHKYTTASDVEASKPSPDIVAAALEKIQLQQEEVFMLGDTPYDIAAAKKNEVKTIALRSGGFSDEQLKGAVKIFDNPHDLLQNLDVVL